ncbi:hypothetical protein GCM10027403_14550 [Arthrobacter tecti]
MSSRDFTDSAIMSADLVDSKRAILSDWFATSTARILALEDFLVSQACQAITTADTLVATAATIVQTSITQAY